MRLGFDAGFYIGPQQTPEYRVMYEYADEVQVGQESKKTGRMSRVTGPGLTANCVAYGYASGLEVVGSAEFRDASDAAAASSIRTFGSGEDPWPTYPEYRDVLTIVENKVGAQTISKYSYYYDYYGRREFAGNERSAFAADAYNDYIYNDRSELTSSHRYDRTTSNEIAAELRLYGYDPIGNRTDSTTGTVSAVYYCGNALNQYTAIDSRSACVVNPAEELRYDADGNLTNAGMVQADFDLDGDVDMPDYYNYFSACFNGANRPPKAGCPSLATDLDGDADVDLADYSLFQACFNGANAPPKCNSAAPVRYTWDGGCRRK